MDRLHVQAKMDAEQLCAHSAGTFLQSFWIHEKHIYEHEPVGMSAETKKKYNEIEILWSAILAVSGALLRRSFLVTGTQAPNYTYTLLHAWFAVRMRAVEEGTQEQEDESERTKT